MIDRREFFKLAGGGLFSFAFLNPTLFAREMSKKRTNKILVLVEFRGGNDGLNTLVPYKNKIYYKNRPTLAIPSSNVLKLDDQLGLNPYLQPLMESWKDKDLAIVLGTGYKNPNRSHFRSIEIWETASNRDEVLYDGWIARSLSKINLQSNNFSADSLILDRGQEGPMAGKDLRNLFFSNPQQFLKQASHLKKASVSNPQNESLLYLIQIQKNLIESAKKLQKQLNKAKPLGIAFPRSSLGRQLEVASKLLSVTAPAPVIKVSLGGFDNHSNQKNGHIRLMKDLGSSLGTFRLAMKKAGMWDQILVMTYSEFGRRVKENASRGTDHGTAAPHFMMGGKVKGGFYGKQPTLDDLDRGDLKFTTDYRRMYATVLQNWWRIKNNSLSHKFTPIECL